MPAIEIDDDAAKLLADACAEQGLSPKTVIILALEALREKRAGRGTRRPSGSGTASGVAVKRRLPNGVHDLLVKEYTPVRGNIFTGSLTLVGDNGEEMKVPINTPAWEALIEDLRIRNIVVRDGVGLANQKIPLIVYAGRPVKTVNGTRLT